MTIRTPKHITLSGVPAGYDAVALARLARENGVVVHIATTEARLSFLTNALGLVAPDVEVLSFPAWDTVPYDRTAPAADITGKRIDTLSKMLQPPSSPRVILTTIAAVMQRVPPRMFFDDTVLTVHSGDAIGFKTVQDFLNHRGYYHADVVMEAGEYAVRGGIIDVFPGAADAPVRLDFFGDEVESIKSFDPLTQRTQQALSEITFKPVREFAITPDAISLFRVRWRDLFPDAKNDVFYTAISEGRYVQGVEHFLPLLHDTMASFFDYAPDAVVVLDYQLSAAITARTAQIDEYYQARIQGLQDAAMLTPRYYPIPPEMFFYSGDETIKALEAKNTFSLTPFQQDGADDQGGRIGYDFTPVRVQNKVDIFDAVADFIRTYPGRVILSAATHGSAERILGLLAERQLSIPFVDTWAQAMEQRFSMLVAEFESGFATSDYIVLTETDMFGEKIIRAPKRRRADDFIADISTLTVGDLVVHHTHGIGRFDGLVSLTLDGAAHDCLLVIYADNDKLFIPVENADVLSRYGSGDTALDRLGSPQFATRKERVKKDLFIMADQLIGIASQRAMNHTDRILAPHGLYQEFCARFGYVETDDQLRTMVEIEQDLARGIPMDRLVCGDVGFGKTEIAMRAAFLAVMSGKQVAIVTPTTLLARQHTQNFINRFRGFPVRIDMLSRLVPSARAKLIRGEIESGKLDIVVGTHAVLAKTIKFNRLGLVVIDEEQHFGVAHKERLKEIKSGVHVLTLTATPIPRTLQLSLAGVRELSIIATPPVDRLAVKTYVMPFDPVMIKEAILREHFRGGQTFFVLPRISDMDEVGDVLTHLLPDIRIVRAHGQMAATQLEQIMTQFTNREYDVLMSTSIIESGLDMPAVNTMIVYRADMFGLAGLYQLRGRVGRGKVKAYAYLTTPVGQRLTDTAQKRLEVIERLDSLGAGFALASHDLDIRGAGNLLGDDQSGHIREIGVALYQKMLTEAVNDLKRQKSGEETPVVEDFSPQISVGLPVLIPDTYVHDLDVRMGLYHRLSEVHDVAEVNSLRAELIDRFGPYPVSVDNLFTVLELKVMARQAHIERLDAGPKGAMITFFQNTFPNPEGLLKFIQSQLGTVKVHPDHRVSVLRAWPTVATRIAAVRNIINEIAQIANQK